MFELSGIADPKQAQLIVNASLSSKFECWSATYKNLKASLVWRRLEIQDSIGEEGGRCFLYIKEEEDKLPITKCGRYSESMYASQVKIQQEKRIILCISEISLEIA